MECLQLCVSSDLEFSLKTRFCYFDNEVPDRKPQYESDSRHLRSLPKRIEIFGLIFNTNPTTDVVKDYEFRGGGSVKIMYTLMYVTLLGVNKHMTEEEYDAALGYWRGHLDGINAAVETSKNNDEDFSESRKIAEGIRYRTILNMIVDAYSVPSNK